MTAPTPWSDLRRYTTARVGLGRAGHAQPTAAHLDFQEAHGRARDAVSSVLDQDRLAAELAPLGPPLHRVASQAPDRRAYLLRPDLGRQLAVADRDRLAAAPCPGQLVFLIADGLCASGVQAHVPPLLTALLPLLARAGLATGALVLASQARVALGDAVGAALQASAVVVLIGERPGLSATDSLGAYLTWAPRLGRSDAERNCISNIRPAGLPPAAAAQKLAWLLVAARQLGATGVTLKDEQPRLPALPAG